MEYFHRKDPNDASRRQKCARWGVTYSFDLRTTGLTPNPTPNPASAPAPPTGGGTPPAPNP